MAEPGALTAMMGATAAKSSDVPMETIANLLGGRAVTPEEIKASKEKTQGALNDLHTAYAQPVKPDNYSPFQDMVSTYLKTMVPGWNQHGLGPAVAAPFDRQMKETAMLREEGIKESARALTEAEKEAALVAGMRRTSVSAASKALSGSGGDKIVRDTFDDNGVPSHMIVRNGVRSFVPADRSSDITKKLALAESIYRDDPERAIKIIDAVVAMYSTPFPGSGAAKQAIKKPDASSGTPQPTPVPVPPTEQGGPPLEQLGGPGSPGQPADPLEALPPEAKRTVDAILNRSEFLKDPVALKRDLETVKGILSKYGISPVISSDAPTEEMAADMAKKLGDAGAEFSIRGPEPVAGLPVQIAPKAAPIGTTQPFAAGQPAPIGNTSQTVPQGIPQVAPPALSAPAAPAIQLAQAPTNTNNVSDVSNTNVQPRVYLPTPAPVGANTVTNKRGVVTTLNKQGDPIKSTQPGVGPTIAPNVVEMPDYNNTGWSLYVDTNHPDYKPGVVTLNGPDGKPTPGVQGPAREMPSLMREHEMKVGKRVFDSALKAMEQGYADLRVDGALPDVDKTGLDNAVSSMRASGMGQWLGGKLGTLSQAQRDAVISNRLILLRAVAQATNMGAKGLDSNTELQTYLDALTDPKKPFQSNTKVLEQLRSFVEARAVAAPGAYDKVPKPRSKEEEDLHQRVRDKIRPPK